MASTLQQNPWNKSNAAYFCILTFNLVNEHHHIGIASLAQLGERATEGLKSYASVRKVTCSIHVTRRIVLHTRCHVLTSASEASHVFMCQCPAGRSGDCTDQNTFRKCVVPPERLHAHRVQLRQRRHRVTHGHRCGTRSPFRCASVRDSTRSPVRQDSSTGQQRSVIQVSTRTVRAVSAKISTPICPARLPRL